MCISAGNRLYPQLIISCTNRYKPRQPWLSPITPVLIHNTAHRDWGQLCKIGRALSVQVNNSLFTQNKNPLIKKRTVFARPRELGLLATFAHLTHRTPHSFWGQKHSPQCPTWGKLRIQARKTLLLRGATDRYAQRQENTCIYPQPADRTAAATAQQP